jgi:hypothetical protein
MIVGSGEKQGNERVRFLDVCSVFVTILFLSICLLCIVPQYGRLAAILRLLAFNHSACLRNARRISYLHPQTCCGLPLHRNEQTKSNETKSRRPSSLHLTCMVVGGIEKQGIARVRFIFALCLLPYYSRVYVVVYCSSGWSFGSHLAFAGVKSLRVSPKCTSHIISPDTLWVISSSERTNKQRRKRKHADRILYILPA